MITQKINRIAKHIPNCITGLNMMLGLSVLFVNISQIGKNYRFTSCIMILIAVLLDSIDGKVARRLNAVSSLGKQLDSFADFVSFGIAPVAILLTHEHFRKMGLVVYVSVALYAIAGAFRLARYNIGDYKDFFEGLPITAAGCILICLDIILHFTRLAENDVVVFIMTVVVLILAVMMISKIKVYRFGERKKEKVKA